MRGILATVLFANIFLSFCIRQPPDCEEFNRLPLKEKTDAAKSNSIEKNFALTRCAYYTEGGPAIADVPIIEGGETSVPFLLRKLDSEDEGEQERAISLLFRIDTRQKLMNRAAVLTKIEKTIDGMKDEQNRKSSMARLNEMKDFQ